MEARPAEVKHLSKRRNINQIEIPLVAASETGIAQTREFILGGCRASHNGCGFLAEASGKWSDTG